MQFRLAAVILAGVLSLSAQDLATADQALAARLASLKTEPERLSLLESEHHAVTPSLVRAILDYGNQFLIKADYSTALDCHRFALVLAEQSGDRGVLGSTMYSLGHTHQMMGDLEEALDLSSHSLALAREIGAPQWVLTARLNGLSIIQRRLGNYATAIESAREALAIAEKLTPEMLKDPLVVALKVNPTILTAQSLNSLAVAHMVTGDYRSALEEMERGYRLAIDAGQHEGAAFAINNIGQIHEMQGNLSLALEYYQRALKLKEEAGNQTHIVNSLFNISSVYRKLGQYGTALENITRAQHLAEAAGDKNAIASALTLLAGVERSQGRLLPAIEHYEKGAAAYRAAGESDEAVALMGMAGVQNATKEYQKAVGNAAHAAKLARLSGDPQVLWMACAAEGSAQLHLGRRADARARFLEAIAAIEAMRETLAGGEETRELFFEDKLSPYSGMIQLALEERRPEEALAFAERAKARVVLDAFAGGHVPISKALTEKERNREQALRGRIASLNRRIADQNSQASPNPGRIGELQSSLKKARLDYTALESSLDAAHPQLRANRLETRAPSLREIAALLPDDRTVALEYVLGGESSSLFVVSKGAPYLHHFSLSTTAPALAAKVHSLSEKLARRDLDFGPESRELYRLLVEPAQEALRGKTTVVIVPDGALWQLPFQALAPAADRYWIEQASIFYAPSLSVLAEMVGRHSARRSASAPTLLAMGNPAAAGAALPEAEAEVAALREIYGAANSRIYVGEQANESVFKRQAGRYTVLHIAAHAELDDRNPMYSHLALARGPEDAHEDGMLEAREMMDLDLKAELVVLSACETARGRVGMGEGLIGMTWALFIAGSPATIATSWKIDSASAARFTVELHRGLKQGQSRAAALRRAALVVMKLPGYQHPYYWSAFSLVGQGF